MEAHPVGERPRGHPAGALGIIHPFPTVLVSLATVALALIAGGNPPTVALLGVGMLGFQASIGATNDLADRVTDEARGAGKPLPAGQIGVRAAAAVAVIGAVLGLASSALVGPGALLLGTAGLACGISYDLWLRPRGLAVLAYALALPLLLGYAWFGAAGVPPPGGAGLLLLAALIGPGLHIANALVDVDLDAVDEPRGLAVRLGRRRGVSLLAAVVATTQLIAWLLWAGTHRPIGSVLLMASSGVLAVAGVVLSADRRRGSRSMGWTCQAVATALLGVGLAAALAGAASGAAPPSG
jgi:4-hydroxybenzoate polyprenyltransferase